MSRKKMEGTSQQYPILLVEDNEDDVIITRRAIEKGGIRNRLYVVPDGEEALNFLRKEGKYKDVPRPGLVLLDLKMPKIDGFEVLKQVKNDNDLKFIPIVVLTSSGRDEDVRRAYTLGCNSYLVKPEKFEKLTETVMEIDQYWLRISRIP